MAALVHPPYPGTMVHQYLGPQAKSRGVKYVEAWPGGGWEE